MSLAGRLEEIELAELLHFLALNNRTGKVSLSRREAHGLVVVRLGRIVYAASSSIRETFGHILVCRGLVTPEVLTQALDRQHLAADGRRLGDASRRERCHQRDPAAGGPEAADGARGAGALPLEERLLPLRGHAGGVERRHRRRRGGARRDGRRRHRPGAARGDDADGRGGPGTGAALDAARDRVQAPFAPALRGEVTLGLLRRAAPLVGRGLLLVLRGDEAHGAGQIGPRRQRSRRARPPRAPAARRALRRRAGGRAPRVLERHGSGGFRQRAPAESARRAPVPARPWWCR